MLPLKTLRIFVSLKDMADLRLVLFRLGPRVCAALATTVREVIPAGRPTRIPGADGLVAGLLNLRGVLLTVVDGRRVIGVPASATAESVLVLDQGGKAVGLAVDEVLDLIEVSAADLSEGDELPGIDPALVQAVGRHDDRVFALLKLDALVAPALG